MRTAIDYRPDAPQIPNIEVRNPSSRFARHHSTKLSPTRPIAWASAAPSAPWEGASTVQTTAAAISAPPATVAARRRRRSG